MYNYYYISLPNISELKQKVLVFLREEKACELSLMDPKDAHSLDTVPGCARYTSTGEADNTELIEGKARIRTGLGQKPPKRWELSKAAVPGH